MASLDIVARARACLGARFRPQGRHRARGLDCVGLVAVALDRPAVRSNYRMRGGVAAEIEVELAGAGLARVAEASPGDVLVMRAGPGQLHLGIWTGGGLVHADAGLGRVVERPGPPPWPRLSVWRLNGEG
jgi:cell wall-associated NlpC family hydrolase